MPALLRASTAPSPGDADAGRGEGLCGARLAAEGAVRGFGIRAEAWGERNDALPGSAPLRALKGFGPNAHLLAVGLDPDLVRVPSHIDEPGGMRCGPASRPGHDPARGGLAIREA